MRLILLGAGEFGLPTFKHLHRSHDVLAVVSQPDRPAGRKRQLTPTDISKWATDADLPLHRWENINDAEPITLLRELGADAAIVIAFGQKLSRPLLDAMAPLTVNLHASLLPRWRGASPINAAILAGDQITGVSVISLADRMDAGLVYATRSTSILPTETAGELHDRLALLGPEAIDQVLTDFDAGSLRGETQHESLVTVARKLSKANSVVDFSKSAADVKATINGLTPWPGVQVIWRTSDGREAPLFLRRADLSREMTSTSAPGQILAGGTVACGQGAIELLEVQRPGGKAMTFDAFQRGHGIAPGDRLSCES